MRIYFVILLSVATGRIAASHLPPDQAISSPATNPAAAAAPAVTPAADPSLEAIRQRLSSPEPADVVATLRILAARGDPAAYRLVTDLLEKSSDSDVRAAGLLTLEKLRYSVPFLQDVIRDNTATSLASAYACYVLGRMNASEAVPDLLTALESPHEQVRENAIGALARIKDMRAWRPLVVLANKDPSPVLRSRAQQALEALAASESGPTADTLNVQLSAPDVATRRRAAEGLDRLGNWYSIELLARALEDPDDEVRRLAARALGDLKDTRAVQPLGEFVPRASGRTRYTALIALGVLDDPAALPYLTMSLRDPDPETRLYAARAIGMLGDMAAGPALSSALADVVPENRREIARALGLVRYPGAIPGLAAMAADDTDENELEAIREMGEIRSSAALPHLEKQLSGADTIKIVTAIVALRTIGDVAAAPALETLARKHSDPWVKEEALAASIELRGRAALKEREIPSDGERK